MVRKILAALMAGVFSVAAVSVMAQDKKEEKKEQKKEEKKAAEKK
jgi:hypothetical protein